MTYSIRPWRQTDGPPPFVGSGAVQVVVNVSDQPCLFVGVEKAIGTSAPRAWFRLGQVVHSARELSIHTVNATLVMGNDLTGATEIMLFPVAGLEGTWVDALKALARNLRELRMNSSNERAGDFVLPVCIAPLPGLFDASGRSPFWDALGRHFGGHLPAPSGRTIAWRERISSLFPRHPIYLSFLGPEGARAVGQYADSHARLATALVAAGFQRGNYVDIVDGGPVFELH